MLLNREWPCSELCRTGGVQAKNSEEGWRRVVLLDEGPDDGVVLGDVVGVVAAHVLIRRRPHAAPPHPRRCRRSVAQLPCNHQIQRLASPAGLAYE